MVLVAETRKNCNECRFWNQNRRRIAFPLSKTALEARFGALQGDTRRLSPQLEVPVRGFLNLKNKEKPIQGALGGIKIVIVRQGSMLGQYSIKVSRLT
jgi:hypothetical protein